MRFGDFWQERIVENLRGAIADLGKQEEYDRRVTDWEVARGFERA